MQHAGKNCKILGKIILPEEMFRGFLPVYNLSSCGTKCIVMIAMADIARMGDPDEPSIHKWSSYMQKFGLEPNFARHALC